MSLLVLDLSEAKAAAMAARKVVSKRNIFKGALTGRLTNDWNTSIMSADQELWTDLRKLRARSRELVKNTWVGEKFLSMVTNNVVGHEGINLQVKVRMLRGDGFNDALGDSIEDSWDDFYRVADAAKKLTMRDIQRLAVRTLVQDGEAIVRKVRSPRNKFNYCLQFIDPDQLDHTFFVERMANGNEIRMGVEVDPLGAPVAYYMWDHHPSEWSSGPKERKRVLAADVIHLFVSNRVGQTRGYPWMAPVLMDSNMLRGYLEAELVAARTSAAKMGFFTSETGDEYVGEGVNQDGTVAMDADPGKLESLPPGVDFTPWDPQHPTAGFPMFVKTCLRGIASGLGVSYHALANDLEGVNYSSGRLGELADRDGWRGVQKFVADHLLHPIYTDWLEMAVLSGQVSLGAYDLERISNCDRWRPRGWAWVDPLKDAQAKVLEIQNGMDTVTECLAEQGKDIEDVAEERASELKLFEDLDIPIGTDLKGVADTGSDTAADGTPTDGSAPPAEPAKAAPAKKKKAKA